MKNLLGMTIIIIYLSLIPSGFGQVWRDLGTVNDLISDGAKLYYFETEKEGKSTSWAADTMVKVIDGKTIQNISEKLFIYPTELKQDKEYLYFATLSDSCEGQVLCDYQDVCKISKKDGSLTVLAKQLKSSIHLSIDGDFVVVSESNGNIWRISKTDGSRDLVIKANEIIMDMVATDGKIYWIEELSDQNSNILTLENTQPKIIAKNLKIPYDLTIQKNTLYWNEVQIKSNENGFSEFTTIKSYNDDSIFMEFQNTTPISAALNEPSYDPYLIFDDYLFLVNNTNNDSVIHMVNLHNSTKYDVGVVSDYDAEYLRTDGKTLFVIGKNQDGFVIDKHTLPITVPEFPAVLSSVMFIALGTTVILSRFWHR
jgi:hypothetical protein